MALRGLVLLCPLTPSRYCGILSFDGGVDVMTLRSSTVVPPHSLSIMPYSLVLAVEGRVDTAVWSCWYSYTCRCYCMPSQFVSEPRV